MKYMSTAKIGLVFLLGALLILSCNGKTTTRTKPTNFQFTINGVLVKDTSLGKDIISFEVLRDSVAFDSAVVKVGTDTVKNSGSGTYFKQATHLFNYGQNVTISISVAKDNFVLNTSILMPGSFKITGQNHPKVTGNSASDMILYFSFSSGASGYFVSILQPGDVDGYTGTLAGNDLSGEGMHIPTETFYNGSNNLVFGKYKVYLVAYRNSFLAYPGMLFFLPSGLPTNNISGANGTIGAGVVEHYDSLRADSL